MEDVVARAVQLADHLASDGELFHANRAAVTIGRVLGRLLPGHLCDKIPRHGNTLCLFADVTKRLRSLTGDDAAKVAAEAEANRAKADGYADNDPVEPFEEIVEVCVEFGVCFNFFLIIGAIYDCKAPDTDRANRHHVHHFAASSKAHETGCQEIAAKDVCCGGPAIQAELRDDYSLHGRFDLYHALIGFGVLLKPDEKNDDHKSAGADVLLVLLPGALHLPFVSLRAIIQLALSASIEQLALLVSHVCVRLLGTGLLGDLGSVDRVAAVFAKVLDGASALELVEALILCVELVGLHERH